MCRVRREIVELLCQRARPYLFSTASRLPSWRLACALDLTEGSPDLRNRLRENTAHFRSRLVELGFDVLPGDHPIVPVMIGNEVAAARFAAKLQELGAYAVSVSYAVVPRVTARIRTQMSAAHTRATTSTSQPTASPKLATPPAPTSDPQSGDLRDNWLPRARNAIRVSRRAQFPGRLRPSSQTRCSDRTTAGNATHFVPSPCHGPRRSSAKATKIATCRYFRWAVLGANQ
jgi:hypothetical protein